MSKQNIATKDQSIFITQKWIKDGCELTVKNIENALIQQFFAENNVKAEVYKRNYIRFFGNVALLTGKDLNKFLLSQGVNIIEDPKALDIKTDVNKGKHIDIDCNKTIDDDKKTNDEQSNSDSIKANILKENNNVKPPLTPAYIKDKQDVLEQNNIAEESSKGYIETAWTWFTSKLPRLY